MSHYEVTAPTLGAERPEFVDEFFGAQEISFSIDARQLLDEVSLWVHPE